MPPVADTPSKTPQRHLQKQRISDIAQDQTSVMAEEITSRQTKSDLDLPETDMGAPSTPQPNTSRTDTDHSGPDKAGRPARNVTKGKPIKQTPRKKQGANQSGSSPTPRNNSTPRPDNRTHSMTPTKQTTTPVQYYAGPTFHASPAASSLPIPKFFSKSVPEVTKRPSMQTAMKEEGGKTLSDQSEGSPTPASVQRVGQQRTREESPLDIFFRADRQDKERQRKEQQLSNGDQSFFSAASSTDRPRHHSRHSINDSMGGLFPMELEYEESPQVSHEKAFSDSISAEQNAGASKSSSSAPIPETPEQAEQRKVKTMALKKLLYSVASTSDATPSLEASSKNNAADPKPHNSQQQKRAGSSPIHKHLAAQTARQMSPCQRPSSNLRKEISASMLPENGSMPELPATPTRSRTRNAYKSAPEEDSQRYPLYDSGQRIPSRSSPVPGPAADLSPYKKMEDDLRRILKIDGLPSDGATGVPS